MKLAFMQPYFFPYIGYFQLIAAADLLLLYDNVNYMKQGWVNRNRIVEKDRGVQYFIMPANGGTTKKIKEVEIDLDGKLKQKLLRTLQYNYSRAQFFNETFPVIQKIFNEDFKTIAEINIYSIRCLMEHLDIQTETLFDSSKYEHIERRLEEKYRNDTDSLLTPDKKTQRIFWVCEELNCGHYLNPIGGTAIYSPDLFAQFGIKLSFIKTLPYSYKQQSKTFHNDLSIIDVMMHCGKKGTQELLTKYVLV